VIQLTEDVFCTQCGHRNPPGSNFCSSCGNGLAPPAASFDRNTTTVNFIPDIEGDDDLSVELGEVPAGVGVLVVKRGPNVGSRFALDTPIVRAGRHPESDIFLDDITVSRRHVEIRHEGDGYVVHDAGSLNGTYLNRERVDTALLQNGDELQIGTFKLVFLTGRGPG
jgi:pSer/pThr/pTyr-binding forkhead associated (FHA) protein